MRAGGLSEVWVRSLAAGIWRSRVRRGELGVRRGGRLSRLVLSVAGSPALFMRALERRRLRLPGGDAPFRRLNQEGS